MTAKERNFVKLIYDYYHQAGRSLPWRQPEADGGFDPYKILVSEIMLQQTQVKRVQPKYQQFLNRFPSFNNLAQSDLAEVLTLWSGLGYNRRAKFLWLTAQQIMIEHGGKLPADKTKLVTLPGIGVNTAGAILAYAFNQPIVFIETNIRSVFLHHFFKAQDKIADAQLMPIVERTLDQANPRQWYWALMDYGSYLKANHPNPSRRSSHHQLQSQFAGSTRQLRGNILQLLAQRSLSLHQLSELVDDERLSQVLESLKAEQLISETNQHYRLGG